jgi:hypothetical protein
MSYEPTIADLMLMINRLEARIEILETKQNVQRAGIHLSGSPKVAQKFYEDKKKEIEINRGK